MHASNLTQLASHLASISHGLLAEDIAAIGNTAHAYWLAHRFRCDAWHQTINTHRSSIEDCGTTRRARLWREITPTLQEILISEPLTRVLAYLARHLETKQCDNDWGPLSHNALTNHLEARHRCLNLMVFGYGLPVEHAVSLNRLRRLMEFYCDQLLGALPPQAELAHYAFEPNFVRMTQSDYRRYPICQPCPQIRLTTLVTSVGRMLHADPEHLPANPRLNLAIAEAVLGMWPSDIFDSFGIPRSRWLTSLSHLPGDQQLAPATLDQPPTAPFDVINAYPLRETHKATRRF